MTQRQIIRQKQATKKAETVIFIFGTLVISISGLTALVIEIIEFFKL